ncbi:hypothetical protein MMC18_004272 [Xylographa bjoerkii]|nr:hypothetical protein [Xylographa bjoerkii]
MKSSTLSIMITLLAASASAAPTPVPASQVFNVGLTFNGPEDSYFLSVPADDAPHPITNPMSVSSISSNGGGECSFFGVDGGNFFLADAGSLVVGPPQALVLVDCDIA